MNRRIDQLRASPLRERLGCWLRERCQAELALNRASSWLSGQTWLDLCNRGQRLEPDPISGGRVCHWTGSSLLTAPRLFPQVGARLLRKCLQEWPIQLAGLLPPGSPAEQPRVSFIVPVGGDSSRIPHFQMSVASLRAQSDCPCEIIVVEHSVEACYRAAVPPECRYLHVPADPQAAGYNKAAAMNAGVRLARAEILVLVDADMLVPRRLAAWVTERFAQYPQLAAMRFARFIFNTDETDSGRLVDSGPFVVPPRIQFVIQNTPMPLATRRVAYDEIGGHDESFVGWGGEDIEFLSRLRTLSLSEGGRIPIVHVWHPFAPQKANGHRNQEFLDQALSVAAEVRMTRLKAARGVASVSTGVLSGVSGPQVN